MAKTRLEIRIEESKKKELVIVARRMKLDTSKVLDTLIDKFLMDNQIMNNSKNKKSEIVRHVMNLNDLASLVNEPELRRELLKEMGELECLL